MIWNVVDRFIPTYVRSRDGAYVLLQLKAENPNQPLSSVEKGCGDCEPMNVRAAKPPVNRKFAGSCQPQNGRPAAAGASESGKSTQVGLPDGGSIPDLKVFGDPAKLVISW